MELQLTGYGGLRKEFRRKEISGSRSFRRRFLLHDGAREAATDLEQQLGRRPTVWDRCGGLGRPENLGRNGFCTSPPVLLSVIISPVPFSQWGLDFIGQLPTAPGQFKYVIVIVDYNKKWIEAEPLATITTEKGTTIFYASSAHPQTNGQAEAVNKLIKQNLKKRLEEAKGLWAAKLLDVLWTLRTTPTMATGESPYLLAYGIEAVVPVEIEVPSERVTTYDPETNARRRGEDGFVEGRRIGVGSLMVDIKPLVARICVITDLNHIHSRSGSCRVMI
ncbi:hypothetical protein ACLB2K_031545 [Fragaria x ananassa]